MKVKSLYACKACGFQTPKWLGKCPDCEAWNSLVEEIQKITPGKKSKLSAHARSPQEYLNILKTLDKETKRIETGISELDRVLGGGIIPGSMLLLGGEPGIGKSTLTLQICETLSVQKKSVLYFSGEESEDQISLRGKRLSLGLQNLKLLNEVHLETILATVEQEKPDFVVVDSIQVIFSDSLPSSAGTVSQVRYCTEALMNFAKPNNIPVLIIGHVTKDGSLAGPRVLEHLVDGVFLLEGDRFHEFRILRGMKNRFGPTNEVGIFEMNEYGMSEVKNPSEKFLGETQKNTPGVAIVCTMEGTRPLLVEVQALVTDTRFGYPRRTASGFDVNRLNLLIAVIERHLNTNLGAKDVFVNVVGGMKLTEPAADLGIILAILSSLKKIPLPEKTAFAGEVGLSGEIRKVMHAERREKETKKLGFTLLPKDKSNVSLKDFCKLAGIGARKE